MLKLFRYMKKNAGCMLLVVALLFVQAYTELSLPQYTSKIVDVGIQQAGIENAAAETFRESAMESLLLLMSEEEQETVLTHYEKENGIYALEEKDSEALCSKILGKAMLISAGLREQGIEVSALSEEERNVLRQEAEKKINLLPESIINQTAVSFVAEEYRAQGVDMEKKQNRYLLYVGAEMLALAFASMIAAVLVTFLSGKLGSALGRDLREAIYEKVLSFSNNEMNRFSTASLITRSTNDIQQVQMVMIMIFRMVLFAPIMGLGGVVKVFRTNANMTWILALAIAVILSVILFLMIFAMPRFKILQKLIDKINQVSREQLTGLMVIRAFSSEKREEARFDLANQDLTKTNLFVNRCMSFMMPMITLVMNGVSVLIIYVGAHGVDNGKMQVGDMMAFIQYSMHIILSFLMIAMVSVILPRANVAAARINEVLEEPISIKNPAEPKMPEKGSEGTLEFKNVSFSYPGDGEEAISDISFRVNKGEVFAIIGSTGSGKSTLLNLIPRFFDVTKGQVLVDGVDVREMDLHDLRKRLGYVPQKSILFSGTIESNLRYGQEEASEESIRKAAEIAQAEAFISAKEDGYRASVAQGGTNVSGGQKQRLSIARAIAADPEIYLFDDSFSALDFATDARLRKALREENGDKTTLIVAQRVSTIMHANQILVLDEGKAVGLGTHKELMKNCEVYQQIAYSQLSGEELNA